MLFSYGNSYLLYKKQLIVYFSFHKTTKLAASYKEFM